MSLVLPRHLTCQQVVELITAYSEGALGPEDCSRFEEHLTTCAACVTYYDQMQRTTAAVGALADHDAPVDPAIERALLDAFRARGAGG